MSFLFIQTFIFLTVCCLFIFLFQFQRAHKLIGVSHGNKLKAESLKVPEQGHAWFWWRVNEYGLAPSFKLGTRTSTMASSLPCQRDGIRRPATSIFP